MNLVNHQVALIQGVFCETPCTAVGGPIFHCMPENPHKGRFLADEIMKYRVSNVCFT